jgi:adenosylcobinamide-GDP ribazoletransferase
VNAFRSAFGYFSIFPVRATAAPHTGALAVLPFVGIVLGFLSGGIGLLASRVLPLSLAIVVAFAASIILSGAIHLDGFLDCCDALFASVTPERRLEILKDSRHGTYALAGIAILVPTWLGAIAAIPATAWPWALAFCSGAARVAAVTNALSLPYISGGESSRAFEQKPNVFLLLLGAAASAACCWTHPRLALLVLPAILVSLALGWWCARQLDGVLVGDCYGAIVVVLKVGLLASVATALWR